MGVGGNQEVQDCLILWYINRLRIIYLSKYYREGGDPTPALKAIYGEKVRVYIFLISPPLGPARAPKKKNYKKMTKVKKTREIKIESRTNMSRYKEKL